MSKRPTAAESVAKSRAQTGAKPVAFTLRPAEIAILDELAEAHGGRKAALMAGLNALRSDAMSPAQALRVLARLVKEAA